MLDTSFLCLFLETKKFSILPIKFPQLFIFILLLFSSCIGDTFIWFKKIFFLNFMAAPAAYGSSWARGGIRAVVASYTTGSKPHLQPTPIQPTPQLVETLDPEFTGRGQESSLHPSRENIRSLTCQATTETPQNFKIWKCTQWKSPKSSPPRHPHYVPTGYHSCWFLGFLVISSDTVYANIHISLEFTQMVRSTILRCFQVKAKMG